MQDNIQCILYGNMQYNASGRGKIKKSAIKLCESVNVSGHLSFLESGFWDSLNRRFITVTIFPERKYTYIKEIELSEMKDQVHLIFIEQFVVNQRELGLSPKRLFRCFLTSNASLFVGHHQVRLRPFTNLANHSNTRERLMLFGKVIFIIRVQGSVAAFPKLKQISCKFSAP